MEPKIKVGPGGKHEGLGRRGTRAQEAAAAGFHRLERSGNGILKDSDLKKENLENSP